MTLAWGGCASKTRPANATACVAGQQRLCPCPDGQHTGTQTCGVDGTLAGECSGCSVTPGGPGASVTQPSTGTPQAGAGASAIDAGRIGNGASGRTGAGGASMPGSAGAVAVGTSDAGTKLADAAMASHPDAGDAGKSMPGKCGNGVIDPGEECDGAKLNSMTCMSLSYRSGTLSCSPTTCIFDTSMCMTMCFRGVCPGH
jgi:hypothetical protein